MLESNDKELQRLQEQLASLRSEKEALEGVLFDCQTNLEATDNKRAQLEKDQQDLLIKQVHTLGLIICFFLYTICEYFHFWTHHYVTMSPNL